MDTSKKGITPFLYGVKLSKEDGPKTPEELAKMQKIPYASALGSLMYAMQGTRPDICYAVGILGRFQSNPGLLHWQALKCVLKYLRRTKDYQLVYSSASLTPIGYTDSDFMSDPEARKSTSGFVFLLGGAAVSWKSVKQQCIADSTTEAEYVAACEAAKEAVWLQKFLIDLDCVPEASKSVVLYCDNSGAVAQSKEPRYHQKAKHIERKFHLIRDFQRQGKVAVTQVASEDNLADPFTKALVTKVFEKHVQAMGVKTVYPR
jgi:hypothetical protein